MSAMAIKGSLRADNLRVGGSLTLEGASITGSALLWAARIGFAPDVDPNPWPAKQDPIPDSILARGVRVGGLLVLSAAAIRGRVGLQGAQLDGGLSVVPVPVDLPAGRFDPNLRQYPRFGETASLAGARIRGEADFRFATIDGELHLDRAVVDGKLRCRLLGAPDASPRWGTRIAGLSLRSSSIRHIDLEGTEDGEAHRAVAAGPAGQTIPIHIDGVSFRDLTVPANDYLMFFRDRGSGFRRSNYIAVERWLRGRGEDDLAIQVHKTMRRHRRERGKMGFLARVGDRVIGVLQAMARRFGRLAFAMLVLVGATTLLFANPESVELKGENKVEARNRPWSWSDAFWMAVQLNVPIVDVPIGAKWEASGNRIRALGATLPVRYDQYASFVTLVAYILVPLIVTGIVRDWLEQRSGDE
jgi:hypothetical protein